MKLQYNEQVTSSIALMKINNHLAPIDSYTVSPSSSSLLSFHHLFEVITLTMNRDIGESYQESINQSLFSRMVQLNNNYYAPLVKSIKSSSITSSIHQVGVMVSIILSMLLEFILMVMMLMMIMAMIIINTKKMTAMMTMMIIMIIMMMMIMIMMMIVMMVMMMMMMIVKKKMTVMLLLMMIMIMSVMMLMILILINKYGVNMICYADNYCFK